MLIVDMREVNLPGEAKQNNLLPKCGQTTDVSDTGKLNWKNDIDQGCAWSITDSYSAVGDVTVFYTVAQRSKMPACQSIHAILKEIKMGEGKVTDFTCLSKYLVVLDNIPPLKILEAIECKYIYFNK
jgi:hypothetical protein